MQNEPALNDKIENDLPLRFAGFGASVQLSVDRTAALWQRRKTRRPSSTDDCWQRHSDPPLLWLRRHEIRERDSIHLVSR